MRVALILGALIVSLLSTACARETILPLCEGALYLGEAHKELHGALTALEAGDDRNLEDRVAAAEEAKRRWPEFVAAFNERRPGRTCAVKYAAPIKGGGHEQIWIMVTALDGDTISGTLANRPVEDIGLKIGDAVKIQAADVKDWLFNDGGVMTGGFSVATLRNAAGKREPFKGGQSMTGGASISTLKNGDGKRDGK